MYSTKSNFPSKPPKRDFCMESMLGENYLQKIYPYIAMQPITYGDVLSRIDFPVSSIGQRISRLIQNHPDSFWVDNNHAARMDLINCQMGYVVGRNTPRYYAAMYLLTASDTLLARTAGCFTVDGIDFHFVSLPGISLDDYILYKAAVCYYTKEGGVTLGELADENLVSDQIFRLVINGLLIAKYGLVATILKKNPKGAEKK